MLIFMTCTFSAAIRLIPNYAADKAKQAGWLSPFVSFVFLLSLILILHTIYKKYRNKNISLMDIMYDIFGKIIGRILVLIYISYITILLSLYVRYYGERIVSTIFNNVDIRLIIVIMLVLVSIVLRSGIVGLARMNEIILPFAMVMFFLTVIFILPVVDFENLLPVSYLDIIPITKGHLGLTGIWVYLAFLFFSVIKSAIKKILERKECGLLYIH